METLIERLKLDFLVTNFDQVALRLRQHLEITLIAMALALAIALPLGIVLARVRWLRAPVLAVLNVLYTVPSISLLVLLVPFVGTGRLNAIIVLVIYAQIILVRNIVVGLSRVDPDVVEAARGMGMNAWQRLSRVELPLALPVLLAGVRIATVAVIGIGTVAGLVGAGGLGRLLFEGLGRSRGEGRIVAGALGAAALAGAANLLLRWLERRAQRATRGER
ncbi:ABC transporter permease [Kallotenue papyrolyticum]|uniref:ABC transporter permease n=1 Tax=Kallotenue papyrolyticum TaxID=1325125 RepID=UPI0004785B2A|nr:ABC transporter permease subunit [Kallotenue papyrolyticum]